MGKITLGEVAIESKATWKSDKVGVPIVGLEHLEPGEITLSNWEIDSENTFTKKFSKGQVLLGRRRVYLRKAVIAPVDGICSGDITVIEAIPGKILPELLPFVIQNDKFFDYAVQGSAGSLSPRVKWEHLKKYSFELPSIDEQKILANKLWAAYRLKESYKKLLSATDEMVKSQFIEMFEGDKYPRISLDAIADEWLKGQAFKKDEICENGDKHCIHYGELFTKYGPVIKEVVSKTSVDLKKPSKNGDILFPASDVTPNGLARCSMLPYDNVVLGGDIIVLRPKEGYSPAYLSYAINQQTTQLLARVNGGLVKHLSAKGLKTVEIPIPSKEKQEEYIRIAEQADKSKFELRKSIEAIDAVIKSLING